MARPRTAEEDMQLNSIGTLGAVGVLSLGAAGVTLAPAMAVRRRGGQAVAPRTRARNPAPNPAGAAAGIRAGETYAVELVAADGRIVRALVNAADGSVRLAALDDDGRGDHQGAGDR